MCFFVWVEFAVTRAAHAETDLDVEKKMQEMRINRAGFSTPEYCV
jgi:hypothetical protein